MMRLFLALWSLLWTCGLPFVLLYLRRRARRDALYGQHLGERFGRYPVALPGAVWVHAVSLGEVRSALPLIRGLLDRGEVVAVTHFTPAGRRATLAAFGPEIDAGRLAAVWVPFDLAFCWRGFHRAFRPKAGLVLEIEIWPRMVQSARDAGVPLYMTNAQYPADSMARDARLPIRPAVMRRFAGALVKSPLQAERLALIGVANITVTGELRFDLAPPPAQVQAARAARAALGLKRPIIALASVTEPEEALFADTAARLAATRPANALVLCIPRAPERFDAMESALRARGLRIQRRSQIFDENLGPLAPIDADVLLGDSLGEMAFYLALADRVAMGGGFQPKGSHNIIEALALGKPVLVGPHIQTIEFPATEAIAAGLCLQTTAGTLARDLTAWPGPDAAAITAFLDAHRGATARTIAALRLS